ncbi:MAG: hypothetical protein WKF97_21980 [Chitinophagaceae bacterium]
MSLLKNILSPFVEFSDEKKAEPAGESKSAVKSNPEVTDEYMAGPTSTRANIAIPAQPYATPPGTIALPEHQQHFEKLVEEANAKNPLFQGTDFKEFVESKADIDAIADEATKYITAFNVLKRTGLTKDRLITTGQEYINLIGRDLNAFQSAHSQQYQKEVKQKELIIQKKAEELQALSDKISALNQEISVMSKEIVQTKDKLNSVKNSFLLAGENKQKEIQTELQKIAEYFK